MKALILVGGFGTRLKPLTNNIPKPLVHFCGAPMVEHQINALYNIGVRTVILAIGYKPETMAEFVGQLCYKYPGLQIKLSLEKVKLNTGGPIKLAEQYLLSDSKFNFGSVFR